ncbi:Asp-tRNA(Asn)/Glu-tRNA(Gln) amidotransferase subunit GatB [Candidatus Curtissbacteria bacterium]|nr:Asp-tRNA(Asn)/Glu-tRNA(Gln) amidotransferase subunit GatB [Candidatus Curtissbacteria bacterium]
MKYQPVIGLEVHVELYTKSKMFCPDSADYFGKKPNTHVCPVCLGLPGALPVPNIQAIEWCVMIGLALNCQIPLFAKFDRKNYFYPDLPKGYQISQYDKPFCVNGRVTLKNGKKIGITRAHMEEDTGKLTHAIVDGKKVSLIDFNRSGVPLVEIVTEPDFESTAEVVEYLKRLQQIIRYLGVSNADMEKGDMRLEPNISLKKVPQGSQGLPPYKVEVKNINSFKFVEKAINYEIERQAKILDRGETPIQETRGYSEAKNITVSQRSKEEAHDYRYFPEPDIPPITITAAQIKRLKDLLPELPDEKLKRFQKDYGLSQYDAEILTRDIALANYFEEAVHASKEAGLTPKQVANVIINRKPDISKVLPATLIKNIMQGSQVSTVKEEDLEKVVGEVLGENPRAVADYKSGKGNALMFLVGQVKRKVGATIDANHLKLMLEERLR